MRRRIAARLFGESHEPVKLGRFRLLETLGAGGMGVVHAAEDDKLNRIVALKVIRDDLLLKSPDERTRLLREARALARLSHPNVVQIHEVVDTDDSIFIVMEYVPGDTLQHWLRAAPRGLPDILQVFAAAGRGLAAAHHVGIVHRDFKPSNVIVGEARVCILDFGLAHGFSKDNPPAPVTDDPGRRPHIPAPGLDVTGTSQLAGTPGYMSPEHILGQPVDARSDQFSFCITLHEALYDRRPFEHEQLQAHIHRAIPLRLPAAGARHRVPRWLRHLLTRGLAPHPDHRFKSMEALLAALGHGIHAPRRRLQLTLATALTAATATAFIYQTPPQLDPCPDASDQLTTIWDPDTRTQVRDIFLASPKPFAAALHQDVERSLDLYTSEWLTARHDACAATRIRGEQSGELMDRRMSCLARRRDELSTLIELLRQPDDQLLASADRLVHSLPDLSTCRDPAPPTTAPTVPEPELARARSKLERAAFLRLAGQPQGAIPLATEVAVTIADPATQAEALLLLGGIEGRNLRRNDPAIAHLEEAHNHATKAGRDDLVGEVWTELAFIHAHGLQRPAEARRLLERARSALQSVTPVDSLATAEILDVEGHILRLEDKPAAARERHQQALTLRQEHLSPEHPHIAASQLRLANATADDGDFEAALPLYEALLTEQRGRLGDDHPRTANVAFNAALAYTELAQYAKAHDLLHLARPPMLAADGDNSPSVASIDLALARVEHATGNTKSAIARLTHALTVFEANFPPNHSERVLVLNELAEYYRLTKNEAAALGIHLKLLELHDRHGLEIPMAGLLINIGEYLCKVDRCREGYHYLKRLEDELAREPPEDPGLHAFPPYGLGLVHLQSGEPTLALPQLERALELLEAHPETAPHIHVDAARHLATCLKQLHRSPSRVRGLLARAAEIEATITQAP